MPELPEVELNCQHIYDHFLGARITGYQLLRPGRRYMTDCPIGSEITGVFRSGKEIYIGLDWKNFIRSHLAMSGHWSSIDHPWMYDYVEGERKINPAHERLRISTDRGDLAYYDQRLFGTVELSDGSIDACARIEYIDTPRSMSGSGWVVDWGTMYRAMQAYHPKKPRAIKTFLCDQHQLPGLGNIYSVEALYLAGIDPGRTCQSISESECATLLMCIRNVLGQALTTGLEYDWLRVYRRKHCPRLHEIAVEKIDKRSVYRCPVCQR